MEDRPSEEELIELWQELKGRKINPELWTKILVRTIRHTKVPQIRTEALQLLQDPKCVSHTTNEELIYLVQWAHNKEIKEWAAKIILKRKGKQAPTNYHLRHIIQNVPSLRKKAAQRLIELSDLTPQDLDCIARYVPSLKARAAAYRKRSLRFLVEELTGLPFDQAFDESSEDG